MVHRGIMDVNKLFYDPRLADLEHMDGAGMEGASVRGIWEANCTVTTTVIVSTVVRCTLVSLLER